MTLEQALETARVAAGFPDVVVEQIRMHSPPEDKGSYLVVVRLPDYSVIELGPEPVDWAWAA